MTDFQTENPSASSQSFGARLSDAFASRGHLCLGIDPHQQLLTEWELPDTAAGAESFGRQVIEATAEQVGIYKPQVAFYERFGPEGLGALAQVIKDARQSGALVIADAKRGDIGSSMRGYAEAWLTPDAPFSSDALTVAPYMGLSAFAETIELAQQHGRGLFMLSVTSQGGGEAIQNARRPDGQPLSAYVFEQIQRINDHRQRSAGHGATPLGNIGVVMAANAKPQQLGLAASSASIMPILSPGFGYQGGELGAALENFAALSEGLIVSESRSLLLSGRWQLAEKVKARLEQVRMSFGR